MKLTVENLAQSKQWAKENIEEKLKKNKGKGSFFYGSGSMSFYWKQHGESFQCREEFCADLQWRDHIYALPRHFFIEVEEETKTRLIRRVANIRYKLLDLEHRYRFKSNSELSVARVGNVFSDACAAELKLSFNPWWIRSAPMLSHLLGQLRGSNSKFFMAKLLKKKNPEKLFRDPALYNWNAFRASFGEAEYSRAMKAREKLGQAKKKT